MEQSYFIYIILGYLSGSMLFGYLFPYLLKGIDVRELADDKNPGTFNAFVFGGFGCGIVTLLAELGKGIVPVALCARRLGIDSLWFALVMAAPVLGHACSIFHKGCGGKAIAVSFGVMIGLFPVYRPLLILIGFYLLFSLVFPVKPHGKRSVYTFLCFAGTCLLTVKAYAVLLGCLAVAGIVIHKHCVSAGAVHRQGKEWSVQCRH